jgi:hypothetical protein
MHKSHISIVGISWYLNAYVFSALIFGQEHTDKIPAKPNPINTIVSVFYNYFLNAWLQFYQVSF